MKPKILTDINKNTEDIVLINDGLGQLTSDYTTYKDFPASNLVTNGNFANGTTGWIKSGTEVTISEDATWFVSSPSSLKVSTVAGTVGYGLFPFTHITENKYYYKCVLRSNSEFTNAGGGYVGIRNRIGSSGNVFIFNEVSSHFGVGTIKSLSAIVTATVGAIGFYLSIYDPTANVSVSFDDIIAIDLTTTFGAGNEPTAEEMDMMLSKFPNSWFDGTVNPFLNHKELYNYMDKRVDLKVNVAQEAWITPTLLNGWVAYDTRTAKYKKSTFGRIYLKGIVKTGTIGTAIFTLPTWYRPDEALTYAIPSNGLFGYVTVNIDGTVICTVGSNVSISLSGINFFV